jgi:hypothetical protein
MNPAEEEVYDGDDGDDTPDRTFEKLGTFPITNLAFLKGRILKPILGKTKLRKDEFFLNYNSETEDLLIELGNRKDPVEKRVFLSAEPVDEGFADDYLVQAREMRTYRDIDDLLENIIYEGAPRDVYQVDITKWREKNKAEEVLYKLPARQAREIRHIEYGEEPWAEERSPFPSLNTFEEASNNRKELIKEGVVIPSKPTDPDKYKQMLANIVGLENKQAINSTYDLAIQTSHKIRLFSRKYLTEWIIEDAKKLSYQLIDDHIVVPKDMEVFGVYIATFLYYISSMMENPDIDVSKVFSPEIRIPGFEDRLETERHKSEAPSSYLRQWRFKSEDQKSLIWQFYRMLTRIIDYYAKPMKKIDDWDIYSYIMMRMESYGESLVDNVIVNASETAVMNTITNKKNKRIFGKAVAGIAQTERGFTVSEIRTEYVKHLQDWALFQFFEYFQYLAKKRFKRAFGILRDQLN